MVYTEQNGRVEDFLIHLLTYLPVFVINDVRLTYTLERAHQCVILFWCQTRDSDEPRAPASDIVNSFEEVIHIKHWSDVPETNSFRRM